MGEVYVNVRLSRNGRVVHKRMLVDTGATFTWVNGEDLRKIGLKPNDQERFETIEGKKTRRKVGVVQVGLLGRTVPTIVVFGKGSDSEVLGLHALVGLRLEVDPVNRILKRCKAVKALFVRTRQARP
jgi:predicted aspartyl protease